MGNIVLLDDLTINKIAAGEVVERPASVIKEMVENSIDAGATNINIEIKNGGISYIRITDNGKGISADDMELAFERHATSKIRSASDLSLVTSMGFRGEALASIAAIANVEMISKTAEAQTGNRIVVEAGKILEMEETGCSKGTTITVSNLFFNTPVRYKFLKKDYTESGYIEDAVTRLALVNPNIAFKLVNTGKTVIQTSGNGKMKDVIYAIYGKDVAEGIIDVDYEYEDIHVSGVVGKPEIARSNRSNQQFFVNKRYVKDKTLAGAAENSFKGLLPIGKYGFLVLNIQMDPSKVDVNVHPAKLEVRFQEENKIFKATYHAIKDTLLKAELIEKVEKPQEKELSEFMPKIEQPREEVVSNSITNLFKRIVKEEEQNPTPLELPKETIPTPLKTNYNTVSIDSIEQNTDPVRIEAFDKLMELQKKLQEEVGKNPNINTNIDQLISDTQKLGENIDYTNKEKKEPEQEETIEVVQEQPEIVQEEQGLVEEQQTQELNEVVEEEMPTPTLEQEETVEEVVENKEEIQEAIQPEEIATQEEKQEELTQEEEVQEDISQDEQAKIMEEIKNQLNELENNGETSPEFVAMYQKTFGRLPATVVAKQKEESEKINAYDIIKDNNLSVFEMEEEYNKPTYKFIGIAFKTYIILEINNEMYILDQHAAHERIMYEKVKANYYQEGEKESQLLLLPDIITLSHKEMDIARDNMEMFENAGFMVEEFGDNTIKLNGVPNICLNLDTKELFLETLDEINTVARTAKQEIEEKFIATVACKAAVKANMALTEEEVDSLMNELLCLPNPFTCPHGRPTAIKMSKNDIEKKFARRK